MKKKLLLSLGLVFVLGLGLVGCGSDSASNKTDSAAEAVKEAENPEKGPAGPEESQANTDEDSAAAKLSKEYPAIIENEGTPIENGVLKVGIVSDSPFKGIFNGFLYSDALDDDIMKYTMDGAVPLDGDFKMILDSDKTPMNIHVDVDKKVVTFKLNPKWKWSNGDRVSVDDIIRTYEIVANKKYIKSSQSLRYGEDMTVIEGIEDYHEGKTKTIKGLERIDDYTLNIHLKDIAPSVYWGGCFVGEFVNAKQLKDVPMDKIQSSDAIRKNPLSYGPYYITDIVSGESVSMKANEHFIYGKPSVPNVVFKIVPSAQQEAALKAGEYDILMDTKAETFKNIKDLKNIKIASRIELYMAYLGFKLGHWDADKNECIVDPNAKMANVNLRRAMGEAIDQDALGEKFYDGLRFRAVSPIAPVFKTLHDPNINGVKYNIDNANKLLDEAGYKDVDGDGYREDPNGKPLEINFAMMSGGEVQEPIAKYNIGQWKKIGLKVNLVDGKLLDLQNFYTRIQNDDKGIDVFAAAFGLASDPNQIGLYGKKAPFNFSRFTSPKLQSVLEDMNSSKALNPDEMVKIYHEFEKVFFEELPIVPTMNRLAIMPINNRVKYFNWSYDDSASDHPFSFGDIVLLADKPISQ